MISPFWSKYLIFDSSSGERKRANQNREIDLCQDTYFLLLQINMSSSCETVPLIILIKNSLRTWLQSVVKETGIKASIKLQMRISSKTKGLRLHYRLSSDLMATSEKQL